MEKRSIEDLKGSTPKELRRLHALEIIPLLKLKKAQADAAYKRLRTKNEAITPIEYFFLADSLMNWYSKNEHLSRDGAAKKLRISLNRFKLLSQASNWPLKPRLYIVVNSDKFSQTDLEGFIRTSWMTTRQKTGKNGKKLKATERYFDDRSLMKALERHVKGKKLDIRKQKKKGDEKSIDAMRMEDKLRQRLMIRPDVRDDGTITLDCGNMDQAYRVTEIITSFVR